MNDVASLLDLVWRKGPLFMRAGGGTLGEDGERSEPITADERQRISNLVLAGHSIESIAKETGRHYGTVARITRHLRTAGRGRPKGKAAHA